MMGKIEKFFNIVPGILALFFLFMYLFTDETAFAFYTIIMYVLNTKYEIFEEIRRNK